MDLLGSLAHILGSPAILFFISGVLIGLCKTDLQIPTSISKFFSLYLMIAIGLKGGHAFAATTDFTMQVVLLVVIGVGVSLVLPFIANFILRYTTQLDPQTAAAVAAHYGSVSIITFVTAGSLLASEGLGHAGWLVAILAIMEAPAILSGVYLARRAEGRTSNAPLGFRAIVQNNGCLLLLAAAFIIGWLIGTPGMALVQDFFVTPFYGILCLFLLDMGLLVAQQIEQAQGFTWSLFFFGLYMPLIGASCGLLISYLLGLDVGTGTMFMVLCGSASYIAVPAAMRLAIPEAQAAVYLPMALAVTFPFNIVIGISLYYAIAQWVLS